MDSPTSTSSDWTAGHKRRRESFEYDTYDFDFASVTASSTSTSASLSTKRRKRQRRIHQVQEDLTRQFQFRLNFQHFKILPKAAPYEKLDRVITLATPDEFISRFHEINPAPIDDLRPQDYSFVLANTVVEMEHLKRFDRLPNYIDNDALPELMKAVDHVEALMTLDQQLEFPTIDDLKHVPYYPNKFAGVCYAAMGMKTRAEANGPAQLHAEDAFRRLMAGEHVTPGDTRIGGRGKLTLSSKLNDEDGGKSVGRMILMMDQRDLKLCGITENVLTDAYSPDEFPVGLGTSWWHGGCDDFISRWLRFNKYFCLDAKRFDSSIDPWMIRTAITIVRRQYVDGENKKYDAYWNFVFEGLVETIIFRDDGVRFQKFVGTTSGHSHNTLLESIITLFIGYATLLIENRHLEAKVVFDNSWVESLGDDNMIGITDKLKQSTTESLADIAQNNFNIDWHGSKSFATTRLMDGKEEEFQGVQFLGKYFRISHEDEELIGEQFAIPYRPCQETFMKLYYPEKAGRDAEDSYVRALGNLYDCAGNTRMRGWLYDFIQWLEPMVDDMPEDWPRDVENWLTRAYAQSANVEAPDFKVVSYVEWLQLVSIATAKPNNK